ncbi:hypothetical protein HMPREF0663_10109 [Hoylesella oralis ATCC 33269]|uniref:Uncharacterized protein n=1 Tax=Hoylesella oralis ATCC 33269 TaxID=873533 RepID=E7RLV9_9BACT|nr:hypothetical protein HMPREF0663_10109 [Hoylesella oralis ATCC 33269]
MLKNGFSSLLSHFSTAHIATIFFKFTINRSYNQQEYSNFARQSSITYK